MKILTRVFYDILLKINKSRSGPFEPNNEILKKYFELTNANSSILIDNLSAYFNIFYNFCFELNRDSMLKGHINLNT
jgi:hypothetical protein